MAGIFQKVLETLHLRKPAGIAPIAPVSPEGQQTSVAEQRTTTTFAPGVSEAAQGAQLAEQLGKPQTAEILNATAQSGIETKTTTSPVSPEQTTTTPPESRA